MGGPSVVHHMHPQRTENAGAMAAALGGTLRPPAESADPAADEDAPLTSVILGADVCLSIKPGTAATPESLLLRTCFASDFFSSVMCCCCCREDVSASALAVLGREV